MLRCNPTHFELRPIRPPRNVASPEMPYVIGSTGTQLRVAPSLRSSEDVLSEIVARGESLVHRVPARWEEGDLNVPFYLFGSNGASASPLQTFHHTIRLQRGLTGRFSLNINGTR